MLNDVQNNLLADWSAIREKFEYYKEAEQKARALVGLNIFPNVKSGAETIELGNGYRVTYTPKTNYNLTVPNPTTEQDKIKYGGDTDKKTDLAFAMEDLAEEMRKASNEGAFIFERLVTWKPSLSVGEYKKLPTNLKAIVDRYVTTSEGAPSISIKAPATAKGN